MRNYHWTLSIALLATAGCHDFTITLDDGDGIGINFGGGVTVAVDDGHDDDATAGEDLPPLGAWISSAIDAQLMGFGEPLTAVLPMSIGAEWATGGTAWSAEVSNEGLFIEPTDVEFSVDVSKLIIIWEDFGQPAASATAGIEYWDNSGAEPVLASIFGLSYDAAGNPIVTCTYPITVSETGEATRAPDGEALDPCGPEAEASVASTLLGMSIDLGIVPIEDAPNWDGTDPTEFVEYVTPCLLYLGAPWYHPGPTQLIDGTCWEDYLGPIPL